MEIQQPEPTSSVPPSKSRTLEGGATENLPKQQPADDNTFKWESISQKIKQFLEKLPDYVGNFLNENKQAIFTLLAVVLAIISVKGVFAVLNAIHGIPLLALFFEVIGLSYTAWFSFRYLVRSQTRQELAQKISEFKQKSFG